MPIQDLIAIGGSAGALDAVHSLLVGLPRRWEATALLVLHTSPDNPGDLARVLARSCQLPVGFPYDGQVLEKGRVFVARPDFHLLVEKNKLRVQHGPRENGFRPAIDPLFRSAAKHYGSRVVGVILSGALDDGASGLLAVKQAGGMAIVQQPSEALFASMPLAALQNVAADYVVGAAAMAELLVRAAREGLHHGPAKIVGSGAAGVAVGDAADHSRAASDDSL
jgi:two-component system chemotaxis response regulator CheB